MKYIQLMRPKHYIKNLLIFVCLICDHNLFSPHMFLRACIGFITFCLLSSAVYVVNDLCDADSDRNHKIKCYRPIASGAINKQDAVIFAIILLVISFSLEDFGKCSFFLSLAYFLVNLGYSLGLKSIPILDIVLLVSGFMLRVSYGAVIVESSVSSWVYLTVLSASFYLGLGKRRNEMKKLNGANGTTRKVLTSYNYDFLDKFMYVCLTLSIVFYALWSTDASIIIRYRTDKLVWTVPIIIMIMMKYSYDIETGSYGDPVDVITGDKWLLLLAAGYCVFLLGLIYLP